MAHSTPAPTSSEAPRHLPVTEARMIELARFDDDRGVLVAAEAGDQLPFAPVRVFVISDVPPGARRAEHANRTCEEVLVCLSGTCAVELHDGRQTSHFVLDSPHRGLYVPPMHWLVCHDFSVGSVLLVLASHAFDPATRVLSWETYLSLVAEPNGA